MLRLMRWLLGYVCFTFSGGFSEGFVNECFHKGYNIRNVKNNGTSLYAECPPGLYPYLRCVAKNHGGKLQISKKCGLIFHLMRFRNRWGIFVGLVVGIMFLSFVSGFVWNIDIVGNNRLSEAQIRSFLNENGFHEGVSWNSVDKDRLENLMLASFDDCAWVHINEEGTSARVEISESVLRPKTVNKRKYTNVKAKKDGVIVKAVVHDGWAVAQKGDAVVKGDLLISGIYAGEKEVNLFAHAEGEYIAEVKEKVKLKVSRTQSEKVYISTSAFKSLTFFGLNIPLYIGNSKLKSADITENAEYLTVNGKTLPIGLLTKTAKVFREEKKTLNDKELTALMKQEIEKKLKTDFADYEILKRKIDVSLNEDGAEAKGYVLCLEDIGKEVRIKVK